MILSLELQELLTDIKDKLPNLNISSTPIQTNINSLTMGVVQRGLNYLWINDKEMRDISIEAYSTCQLNYYFSPEDIDDLESNVARYILNRVYSALDITHFKYPWAINHHNENLLLVYTDERDNGKTHCIP